MGLFFYPQFLRYFFLRFFFDIFFNMKKTLLLMFVVGALAATSCDSPLKEGTTTTDLPSTTDTTALPIDTIVAEPVLVPPTLPVLGAPVVPIVAE
jgi:hypothetical protein